MKLKIYEDSANYTCQVIKLPPMLPVKGLDNLVEVVYQGNSVLVGKDYNPNEPYVFFPAECQISDKILKCNGLYRHSEKNLHEDQKGFFEDNRRVRAIKFKGVISSGFILPLNSSFGWPGGAEYIKIGDEFNEIDGVEICKKYYKKTPGLKSFSNPRTKMIDNIIDSKMAPEHMDTAHLLKNTHKLSLDTEIVVTYKMHGTSARTYNTLVKKKLTWKDKLAKFFGIDVVKEKYEYVCASRRCIKSVGFEELPGKNHFFTSGDLWSEVAKQNLKDKLNEGECVYYEIVGKTYSGEDIQSGYSYGFIAPIPFVYRISNINHQGIEIDLSYDQMVDRCTQLNLRACPILFKGTLLEFIKKYIQDPDDTEEALLSDIFYNLLLEKPSILDPLVVEEGFCIRVDKYPKPEIFKIKSKKFLLHESNQKDKEIVDIEESQIKEGEEDENMER